MQIDIVDDLKQPEYTGENRCEPCTILNLAIAAVVGSLIARKTRLGGLLAVGISVALIYLRGYLVPGTPTLTKRYLPPEVLRWFGKDPDPGLASGFAPVEIETGDERSNAGATAGDSAAADDEAVAVDADGGETSAPDDAGRRDPLDLESYFLEHDVLEPCEEMDDLCLTDDFEGAWLEEIGAVDESDLDAAAVIEAFGFGADPETFDLEENDDAQLLLSERGVAGRWPSHAALLADVAASHVLEARTPDWDALESEAKGQVLNGLRMFLETCPASGGDISMDEEVVESCCSSHQVVAVTCDETGERLFEQRIDDIDA